MNSKTTNSFLFAKVTAGLFCFFVAGCNNGGNNSAGQKPEVDNKTSIQKMQLSDNLRIAEPIPLICKNFPNLSKNWILPATSTDPSAADQYLKLFLKTNWQELADLQSGTEAFAVMDCLNEQLQTYIVK